MTQKTRATFKTDKDSTFADNTTQDISEADLRSEIDHLADSTFFKSDQEIPYDVVMSFYGFPAGSEVLATFMIGRNLLLPADFAGAAGDAGVDPTADYDIDVQDDGASIGTITIASADGSFSFTTVGNTAKQVAAGSKLTFVGQSTTDSTLEDIFITLLGTV